jgi:hypothetical protein
MDMAIHGWNRSPRIRNLLAATVGVWAILAAPSFAFVFGEPLPQLPPFPTDGPPPIVGTGEPPVNPDFPPDLGGPGPTDPPILTVSSTPEPATLIAGLMGVGILGAIAARKRRRAQA